MQNIKRARGFSELKQLLIQKFKIERDASQVRIHFTVQENSLYLHDYDQHENQIELSVDIAKRHLSPNILTPSAQEIVMEALFENNPAEYLNIGFKLHGTYLS